MCGRTACTLAPEELSKACCYKSSKGDKFIKPLWRNAPNGRTYRPSHNVCPTDITPVLLSGNHFGLESERILQPMMWGIIPPWHKGDYKSHKLSTNNCRIENLRNSKLYKGPFLRGQRCVVVCDGFYEWQTTKGKNSKQPYFIYMPQSEGIKIEDPSTWNIDYNEDEGWKGPKLLKMAAIFDLWNSPEGEEIFSYSIITLESNKALSWLHHRMPAILESEDLVTSWLDFGTLNSIDALGLLRCIENILWHPVSMLVNNSRNKDINCNKPMVKNESVKKEGSKSADLLKSWLQNSVHKRPVMESEAESCNKKVPKIEKK